MTIDKEKNRLALDRISFHLDEAMKFCTQLDISGLDPLRKNEWDDRIKICKKAIEFTKESLHKLSMILK